MDMGLGRETRRPTTIIVCQPYVEDDWDAKNALLKRVEGERERSVKNALGLLILYRFQNYIRCDYDSRAGGRIRSHPVGPVARPLAHIIP